jgi:CRP/FNR family cyclic AMP-dependent transcriptional regulator
MVRAAPHFAREVTMARTAQVSTSDVLEQVPLLSGLSNRDRNRLAKSMKELTFPAGKQIVVEGKRGVGFFIIVDGNAAVTIGGREIRMLGPGDYFGEMALVHGEERSATVTADSELRCLTMTSWVFKGFVADHPNVAWELVQTLARRLRQSETR